MILDASVLVAAATGLDADATWAESVVLRGRHAAPDGVLTEVTHVLARLVRNSALESDEAWSALDDVLHYRIDLQPFAPLAARVWELRHNVRTYDAWYVALAEAMDAPLATLDRRLAAAPGPRCEFLLPGQVLG